MSKISHEVEVGKRTLTLETGELAGFATSSVLARYGDTMVLATVVSKPLSVDPGYMPLTVEYIERLYAGGRIKGSQWVKRDGRPTDDQILSARLIDRSLRPLFPKSFRDEIQVIATVVSVDGQNDPSVLAGVAASAALATSSLPWDGPVGMVRVGLVDDTPTINPLESEMKFSDLDLVVTGHNDAILMLEAGVNKISEEKLIIAIDAAQKEIKILEEGILEFAKKVGRSTIKFVPAKDTNIPEIEKKYGDQIEEWAVKRSTGAVSEDDAKGIKDLIKEDFTLTDQQVGGIFEELVRKKLRAKMLQGKRPDGRKPEEIRQITIQAGVLPRTHGSAIFTRGQTQALSVATLGVPGLELHIESAEGEEIKRYIHHYSMPPFATGETGRVGMPGRREIGHGALAERALLPVLPKEDVFPYTIQVVSEILASNGSTSMASVCGSTLSLMDAGVPIAEPVAGIAMGLVVEGEKFTVLSDIAGIEDGGGDMDFKVAGTKDGITAIQLDVKTKELTLAILTEALARAKEGRLFILGKITEVLEKPRGNISKYAPRVALVKIDKEKIGEVVGPGGRTVKKIIAETGAQVQIEDDGTVSISGIDDESVAKARATVEGLVKVVQPGEVYEGEVARIQPFGAFVQILPGKDGLVHISDMADTYVENPEDIVQIGQKVTVRVKEVDELGRINLTMRTTDEPKVPREGEGPSYRSDASRSPRGPRREGSFSGPRSGGFRRSGPGGPRREGGFRSGGASRAPHFPTSRYLKDKRY